ncbi:hypothetical protein MLD38_004048 [Melastoma candidum]|uniref:Uncharacterized protein n=1 Tax=Melastoma candidum TaxID=119954 RepID=A0ACB9S4D1_9MYRT|nr:hypothetical protein MLD38_004048 [Melastoma candidum]
MMANESKVIIISLSFASSHENSSRVPRFWRSFPAPVLCIQTRKQSSATDCEQLDSHDMFLHGWDEEEEDTGISPVSFSPGRLLL